MVTVSSRGPRPARPCWSSCRTGFEARVTDTVKRGDHTVFVAEVVNAGVRDEKATPMLLRSTGMNYGG
jgi:flavin reductase (DIM6/NTAB) family NADH-FMN oxidoreductase RutF